MKNLSLVMRYTVVVLTALLAQSSFAKGLAHLSSGTLVTWNNPVLLPANSFYISLDFSPEQKFLESCMISAPGSATYDQMISGVMKVVGVTESLSSSLAEEFYGELALLSPSEVADINYGFNQGLTETIHGKRYSKSAFISDQSNFEIKMASGAVLSCRAKTANLELVTVLDLRLALQAWLTIVEPAPVPVVY